MFKQIQSIVEQSSAPIKRLHGIAGVAHDLGQWICDKTAVFLTGIPAIYLIARSVFPH